jgi:hypothetical protein
MGLASPAYPDTITTEGRGEQHNPDAPPAVLPTACRYHCRLQKPQKRGERSATNETRSFVYESEPEET